MLERNRQETFDALIRLTRADRDSSGGYAITCPLCGKEPSDRGHVHAHFNEGKGWYCHPCQKGGSLEGLLRMLGGTAEEGRRAVYRRSANVFAKPAPQRERPWEDNVHTLLDLYQKPPDLIPRWQSYKPVSETSIRNYHLGFGRLPGQSTARLIVPIVYQDRVVALHGRDVTGNPDAPKWICAAGSSRLAWGLDDLGLRTEIWIGENFVDRILMTQRLGHKYDCMALGGVRMLFAEEIEYLRSCEPKRIVVCLDNDLAGQPNEKLAPKLIAQWHKDHPQGTKAPEPFGPRIVNALRSIGLPAYLFGWPDHAPHKADIGWVMTN